MNVYIRVDASIEIGAGHVMRCLTLAKKLGTRGATVTFICREHMGHLCDLIEENGYKVMRLPVSKDKDKILVHTVHSKWLGVPMEVDSVQTKKAIKKGPVDLLVVDHYAINEVWERSLREISTKIMVIDDLADRKHDCDYLIDQNYIENYQNRYHSLVPSYCKTFLGPYFVLLREEFYIQGSELKIRSGPVKRILLFFGGSDETNETKKALGAFLELGRRDIQVDVVVGHANPNKKEIAYICKKYDFLHLYCQVNHMAELMYHSDLSIGAGGATTWERCYLGLPSIVLSIADNQVEICETLGRKQLIKYVGEKERVKQSFLTKQIKELIDNEEERNKMSILSYLLMKENHMGQQMMIQEIMKVDG